MSNFFTKLRNACMQAHDSLRHAPNFNIRKELHMKDIPEDVDSDSIAASSGNGKGKPTSEKVRPQSPSISTLVDVPVGLIVRYLCI